MRGMVQVVDYLPCKSKALSSNLSTTKKKIILNLKTIVRKFNYDLIFYVIHVFLIY
jgi:hypothetical protein